MPHWAVGNGPVVIMLHCAVNIGLQDRGAALHDPASVHAALASIRRAPVDPGAPANAYCTHEKDLHREKARTELQSAGSRF